MKELLRNDGKVKILKVLFILMSIVFVIPSIIYLVKKGTILGFNIYYNFFINSVSNKIVSTCLYLIFFTIITAIYLYFITKKNCFKNIKQVLTFTGIVSGIFLLMLPWTSSDIFYYMGVGELNSVYGQNPYYITMKQYGDENKDVLKNDSIMQQGYNNYWANTTVVYGPIAQLIFSGITKISFENINVCIFLFKLLNIILHLINVYLIYKITKKLKFSVIYGLNPFVLLEFIGMLHNDIMIVFFALLSMFFLVKKKKILLSILFLAIATGIKYFTILLLPVIILYYYRDEKRILKRIIKCIQFGFLFIFIIILEYILYFKDFNIFTAMIVQTDRYCKSLYSSIYVIAINNKKTVFDIWGRKMLIGQVCRYVRNVVFGLFTIIYIKFCIDLLFTKKIKIQTILRKYSFCLLLFIISFSNFQQWYLLWLFASLPWQKSNVIRNIIGLSLASEIGNTIYMFKTESYKYDGYFVFIIALLFIIWKICTNKKKMIDFRILNIDRTKNE